MSPQRISLTTTTFPAQTGKTINCFKSHRNSPPCYRHRAEKLNNSKVRSLLSTERFIIQKPGCIFPTLALLPHMQMKSPSAPRGSESDAEGLLTLTRVNNTIPTQVPLPSIFKKIKNISNSVGPRRCSSTIRKTNTAIERKRESLLLQWAYPGNQEKNWEIIYFTFPAEKDKRKRKTQPLKARDEVGNNS